MKGDDIYYKDVNIHNYKAKTFEKYIKRSLNDVFNATE